MVRGFITQLPYIAIGLIVMSLFVIGGRLVSFAIHKLGGRTSLDATLTELAGRLAYTIVIILGVFVSAVVIFPTFAPGDLVAGLGITSVAVGFAFKEVLQNFFAGIMILWRRPFVVGDEIMINDFEGVVDRIDTRATRLRTYDGEKAVIPNADVYTSPMIVRTAYDARRLKFVVGVGYQDDIEEARETILGAVRGAEGVLDDPEPSAFVFELAGSSVNFNVYFWIDAKKGKQNAIYNRVATGIKYALDKAGIDMPYPHSVILFHDQTAGARSEVSAGGSNSRAQNGRERR